MKEIMLGRKKVGGNEPCFVIAEIGHNHQGNLELCKEMFRRAKECGADAVKLQKRNNKELYTSKYYNRPYENENSFGLTYGEHREHLEFDRDEYIELIKYANELDIFFFATAFDFSSVDFLQEIGMPAFKFASGDIKNIPLLEYAAKFNKPMIISTGASIEEDVERAYKAIHKYNDKIVIMQCTSGYPAQFEQLDIKVIPSWTKKYSDAVIGWSSHDGGIAMATVACALGAKVIEKHFTLDRSMKGTDHCFSLEPTGMRKMCRDIHRCEVALGDGNKKLYKSESTALDKQGKALYFLHDFEKGHVIEKGDIVIKSPGGGIPPYKMNNFIGTTLLQNVLSEQLVTEDVVEVHNR